MSSLVSKITPEDYIRQIERFVNGEITFEEVSKDQSFRNSIADAPMIQHAQDKFLANIPKHKINGDTAYFTYNIDERGEVSVRTPLGMPSWKANRVLGDEDQFRRKAREMRRIQKKLAARGIETKGIEFPFGK